MSSSQKLIDRLRSIPSDFTWNELVKALAHFGYIERKTGKTGGSRRKFSDSDNNLIILHKPHPSNIIKKYALKQIIETLQEKGRI